MATPAPAADVVQKSASTFWRAAGMTYIGYANQCAVVLRKCMKEPFKSQSLGREKVHYKFATYTDGQQQKPVYRGVAAGTSPDK